ncbi:peptide deformylase [candidate division WWE3 bacterium]|uniref:Peptide deformylase n=1 Tax=candidate division WWE3 bacterium TaxID=2053526 RepID=A0A7X9E7J4_UNCKA|nr:peptide deformylase [candidate division WWE3 bacterium]
MAVKAVITVPNSILNKKAQKVSNITSDVKNTAKDLLDTVKLAKDPEGAGLAAPQIGISQRIIVVRNFFEDPINPQEIHSDDIILINPKITSSSSETETDWEGCLSVPDKYGLVERFKKIKVTAKDLNGSNLKIKAEGFFARTIQHEVDHLNGILFTSKVIGNTISQKEFDEIIEKESLV